MLQYEGAECPYCHKTLHDTDEITVCPVCGAPYHRACAAEAGGCVLDELHKEGRQWQKITRPGASSIDGRSQRRCSRCGTLASPGAHFCEICGNPLDNDEPSIDPQGAGEYGNNRAGTFSEGGWNPYRDGNGAVPPYQMPFDPFTNPLGGLDPEETIDGIPAKDAAVFIKQNTPYFLPKFKAFFRNDTEGKKSLSWNWSAFIFDSYYLLYRKMYPLGIITLILSLLLSIPSLIISFDNITVSLYEGKSIIDALGISSDKLYIVYNMCSFLSLAMKLALATLSNKLYAGQALKKIKRIKSEKGDSPDYHSALSSKGGVSITGVIVAVAVTTLISTVSSAAVLNFIGI